MELDRIKKLALDHLDGRISDSDFAELQRSLLSDTDARRVYAELARMDAELQDSAFVLPLSRQNEATPANQQLSGPRLLTILSIAAAILVFAVPLWSWMASEKVVERSDTEGSKTETSKTETPKTATTAAVDRAQRSPVVRSIAVISAEANATWGGSKRLGKGTALEPGKLELLKGLAQIDFFSGASVTLTGPAEIDLQTSDLAVLHHGRVKADVPPAARGFEIRTADVVLEDLGTSFGIVANANGESDVVVFDGEVKAVDRTGEEISLYAGDSASLSNGQATPSTKDGIGDFPDISAIVEESGGLVRSRYDQWRSSAIKRRQDPRLIAYYDFEGLTDASRRLPNRAAVRMASELDGGIVGARVTNGRWDGKPALDFRGEGDRVRFQIPGEFDAITLYAWVRIDALDRTMNSLFLTDYFDPGEIHWQISVKGALHFATSPVGVPPAPPGLSIATGEQIQAENRRFWSDQFWDANRSGNWFFFATTADRNRIPGVTHYINGKQVGFSGGSNMDRSLPKLRIGGADLGNWTDPIWAESIRSLNGRIDEFAIYSTALTSEEIESIYLEGKP